MPHQCTDCGRQFEDGSKEMLSGCPNCGGNKFQFLPGSADPGEQPEPATEPQQAGSERSVARTVGNAASAVRNLVGSSEPPEEVGAPEPQEANTPGPQGTGTPEPQEASSPTPQESPTQSDPVRAEPAQSESARTESVREQVTTAMESEGARSPASPSSTSTAEQSNRPTRRQSKPTTASMAERENKAQASARSELVSPDELPSRTDESRWPGQRNPVGREQPDQASTSATQTETTEQTDRPDLSELRAELNQQFESIKVLEPGQYELNLMELFDREEYIVALQEDGKYTVQVPEHWQE